MTSYVRNTQLDLFLKCENIVGKEEIAGKQHFIQFLSAFINLSL